MTDSDVLQEEYGRACGEGDVSARAGGRGHNCPSVYSPQGGSMSVELHPSSVLVSHPGVCC